MNRNNFKAKAEEYKNWYETEYRTSITEYSKSAWNNRLMFFNALISDIDIALITSDRSNIQTMLIRRCADLIKKEESRFSSYQATVDETTLYRDLCVFIETFYNTDTHLSTCFDNYRNYRCDLIVENIIKLYHLVSGATRCRLNRSEITTRLMDRFVDVSKEDIDVKVKMFTDTFNKVCEDIDVVLNRFERGGPLTFSPIEKLLTGIERNMSDNDFVTFFFDYTPSFSQSNNLIDQTITDDPELLIHLHQLTHSVGARENLLALKKAFVELLRRMDVV